MKEWVNLRFGLKMLLRDLGLKELLELSWVGMGLQDLCLVKKTEDVENSVKVVFGGKMLGFVFGEKIQICRVRCPM